MNNDLEKLYGNSNNNINQNNNKNEPINNNISTQAQDLSSLYDSNLSSMKNINNLESSNDISLNQEGLAKMYNQNTTDLDTEPVNIGSGPKIINNQQSLSNNINIAPERVTEEDLLVAYVGKNFVKIASNPFNFAAFFFNAWYLFYRKKILYGVIFTIIYFLLSAYINSFILSFGLALLVGVAFNGIYIKEAKNNIKKIKLKNPNKTMSEIKDICKKKGGRSLLYILFGIVIQFITLFIAITIISALGLTLNVSKINFNELNDLINKNEQVAYAGILSGDTEIEIKNEYEIDIPKEYKAGLFNSVYEYQFETEAKDENAFIDCSFSLYKVLYFNDAKDLIRQMSKYYLKIESVDNIRVNGIHWYWFSTGNDDKITYYYATNKEEKVFIFTYDSSSEDDKCLSNKDIILNTIKQKQS